ncbi:MAG: sporulation integral membrane protein YtvI [Clostridia bacterium]|nr:sporulation integral membrane protein YtvI [Clostridia bacterium]
MSIRTIFFMALGLLLLYGLFTVGFPFLLALLVVVLQEPIVQFINKKLRLSRPISAILVSSLFTVLFFLILILLISKATRELVGLSSSVIRIIREVAGNIDLLTMKTVTLFLSIPPQFQAGLKELLYSALNSIQTIVGTIAGYSLNIAAALPSLFIETIVFFIAFYIISFSLPNIKQGFLSFFDPSTHARVETVMDNLYKAVIGFIRGQIIISILIFTVTAVGFYLLKVKYALTTALVVTLVDFLPIFGAGSVIVPMAIYDFFKGELVLCIGLLVLYGLLIVLRRSLEPKILGDAMGISALGTLASMYVGFELTGPIGLILGPSVLIVYTALVKEGVIKINIKF